MSTIPSFFAVLLLASSSFASDDPDCRPSQRLRNMDVECVSCGIQSATGGQLVPSDRWIALIAYSTSRLYPNSTDFTDARQNLSQSDQQRFTLYRHMAEKIQAYGVCLDHDLDAAGVPVQRKAYPHLEAADMRGDWVGDVTGSRRGSGDEARTTLRRVFGMADERAMRDFFHIEGWATMSLEERRRTSAARVDRAAQGNSPVNRGDRRGEDLQRCMRHSQLLIRNHGHFRMDGEHRSTSIALCQGIARACGMPDSLFCSGGQPQPARGQTPPAGRSLFTAPAGGDPGNR